eukprot:CAMPEP_0175959638 /NCGR_PEP_ID=MMETSP0108-20121206/34908_1 /TAXON_ID=195067 ORGANISM="Goniomonas pacifica, Strain CCMP1869" /NCGR_SAMPLE_ID=MMETSP0108 /ASSEMBLY_ACC=CAM_ASM_000204 /LENGTH=100 /DNA_ID=CAMNT_0017287113 /DNA_START=79 /DNA_END=381 /DNA_ORIENTATION=-
MQKNVSNKQKLLQQHNENELVQKELNMLEDDAEVYKLIGPTLLLQDVAESRANVQKRLQWISDEMKRLDAAIKGQEKSMETKKGEIQELQQKVQAQKAQS